MSLHNTFIDMLTAKIPDSEENHLNMKYSYEGLYPDLVVTDKNSQPIALHEVQNLKIRPLPNIGAKRVLWILVPGTWDEVYVAMKKELKAEAAKRIIPDKLHEDIHALENTKSNLEDKITALRKEFILLIKEKRLAKNNE